MSDFALWLERVVAVDEEGGNILTGEPLSPGAVEGAFPYDGPALLLSPRIRDVQRRALRYVHVGQVDRPCWNVKPAPAIEPPFLVTNDERMAVIFSGAVLFDLSPRYRDLLAARGNLQVAVGRDDWIGVLTVRRSGLFRKTTVFNLIAFSPEPRVPLEAGEVFCPSYPSSVVGKLLGEEKGSPETHRVGAAP
jgi:hypothetical protein